MKDAMLDLETLGNHNNAVVTQIGACYFDRNTGEIGEEFIVGVDIESSLRAGFEVTGSTIEWWLNQSKEAQSSMLEGSRCDVAIAAGAINSFLKKADCIWSHATFDYVILMNHLHKLGLKPSFHYRAARDIRTIVDLAGPIEGKDYQRVGVHHNALDDCRYQVQYVVDCFRRMTRNEI